MNTINEAVDAVLRTQGATLRPLGVILAGHNGSGKSTMWRRSLAHWLEMPLINADRMMLSILPEPGENGHLVSWAARLRDRDTGWMQVAQQGVQAFVGHAIGARVPFAMETVFSYWDEQPDGRIASKIDLITNLQAAGIFVLLVFVGPAQPRGFDRSGRHPCARWRTWYPGHNLAATFPSNTEGDRGGAEGY